VVATTLPIEVADSPQLFAFPFRLSSGDLREASGIGTAPSEPLLEASERATRLSGRKSAVSENPWSVSKLPREIPKVRREVSKLPRNAAKVRWNVDKVLLPLAFQFWQALVDFLGLVV
jgi:hypothetical protein